LRFSAFCFFVFRHFRCAAMWKSSNGHGPSPGFVLSWHICACEFRPGSGRLAAIRGVPQREPHFLDYPFYRNSGLSCLGISVSGFDSTICAASSPPENVLSSQVILMRHRRCRYLRGSPQFILALLLQYTVHPLGQLPGHSNDCHSGRHFL